MPSAIGASRWTFGIEGETVVPVQGNLRANNGDALLAAAIAGQGLIYQPTFIVGDSLRDGTLVPVLPGYPTYRTRHPRRPALGPAGAGEGSGLRSSSSAARFGAGAGLGPGALLAPRGGASHA